MRSSWLFAALAVFAVGCGEADLEIDSDYASEGEGESSDDLGDTEQALVAGLLDEQEAGFLTLINNYRVANGLGKLRVSILAQRAAEAHSKDMAAYLKMSHDSSDGTDFVTRYRRFQPCGGYIGENVAYGYESSQTVFDAWKNSPGHDSNMKGANYKVIGIARVLGSNGRSYWTTDFSDCVDALLSAGFGTIASNGGFESTSITGGVGWNSVRTTNKWHTSACVRQTSSPISGTASMRCNDADPGTASATQLVKAKAGVNYRASATARRNSGAAQQALYLDFLNSSFQRISVKTVLAPASSTASRISVEGSSPSGTAYVRVILYGSGGAGHKSSYDWEDVRIEAW